LENIFVLDAGNIFWVMIVALTLAWSLLVVWRVVLLNGKERFGIDQWLKRDTLRGRDLFWTAIPTLSLFVCACVEKRQLADISWWKWLGDAFLGAVIAYVAGFFGLVISITLAPQYHKPAQDRFHIPFPYCKKILTWADQFRLIPSINPNRIAQWNLQHIPEDLRAGYLDHDGHLYPGHWLILMLLVISLPIYFAVGAFKEARLGMPSSVPALSYILVGMLVANWVLSMLSFFLDRYRVPLILPILLFCTLGGQFPQSDHYFMVRDGILLPPVSPAEALAGRQRVHPQSFSQNQNGAILVVATAGGGIQAAGWTARVLTGLQEQCSASKANFADSVAAISAVSGGAVGTLAFVNQYDTRNTSPGFHATPDELTKIIDLAEAPALSEVAWALVYVDPFRALFPYVRLSAEQKTLDRGFALEETWRNRGSINAYLSNWRDGVAEGKRPAVIFNATVAETGQPLLLATTDFNTGSTIPARQTFAQAYPNCDIPVVTATRLAASFPFVSPASRPLSDRPEYHIVDGGYYDNFGVDSLAAWLDQALSDKNLTPKPDVLFVQIRSFPQDAFSGASNKGWFYQSYAPVTALMSVRTTAQLVRDRENLELLQAKWGESAYHASIKFATFVFQGANAPLSWELTKNQRDDIETKWNETLNPREDVIGSQENNEALRTVRAFCSSKPSEVPASANAPR